MSLKDRLLKVRDYFIETPPDGNTPPAPVTDEVPTPTPTVPLPSRRTSPYDAEKTVFDNTPKTLTEMRAISASLNAPASNPAPMSDDAVLAAMTGPRTVEQIVRASDGPNLEDIKVAYGDAPLPVGPDGAVDFPAIYAHAGLPAPPFGAEQMIGMLEDLPDEMPLEMKRKTVRVAISAMGRHIGATPETIATDASRKLAALAAFVDESDRHIEEMVSATETEIAALLSQVEEKRQSIASARERRTTIHHVCEAEADRLDDVTAFFATEMGMPEAPGIAPFAPPTSTPMTQDVASSWENAPSIDVPPNQRPEQ